MKYQTHFNKVKLGHTIIWVDYIIMFIIFNDMKQTTMFRHTSVSNKNRAAAKISRSEEKHC